MSDTEISPGAGPVGHGSGQESTNAARVWLDVVQTESALKTAGLREERIAETLPRYQGIMRRALDGTASPRQAIKAFCLHCVGDLRDQITNCTGYACPLYAYRPYQDPDPDKDPDGPTAAEAQDE